MNRNRGRSHIHRDKRANLIASLYAAGAPVGTAARAHAGFGTPRPAPHVQATGALPLSLGGRVGRSDMLVSGTFPAFVAAGCGGCHHLRCDTKSGCGGAQNIPEGGRVSGSSRR
jgi:hypothetical protein